MLFHLGSKLFALTRVQKRVLMLLTDIVAIPLALWFAWYLRFGDVFPKAMIQTLLLFPVAILGSIAIFIYIGLYRAVVHFMSGKAVRAIAFGSISSSFLLFVTAFIFRLDFLPRSIPIIYGFILLVFIGGSRWIVRSMYQHVRLKQQNKQPVIIYGAGEAGFQLAKSLISGEDFYPCAFVDNNKALAGCTVNDVKVYPPSALDQLISSTNATRVLLAVPSATKKQRKSILDLLKAQAIRVQSIPSLEDIVSGEAELHQLQDIKLEDLLGRDPVPPYKELFTRCIKKKNVFVSGAGGSIGSELCRQIITAQPTFLILYELSELALYTIEQELNEILSKKAEPTITIVAVLGSVCDPKRLQEVFTKYPIDTVYHAAAYKHVPLVEGNIFQGIRNNLFGTKVLAEVALAACVKNFVLISTDKAVRPTNVMGATKRSAELVLQALTNETSETIFSMVRFGNVLGSSGSVVPLFQKQIAKGGPVTVTHEKITRFFMTIPEAAQLVIQAGAMGNGGDVFVLDMGAPVKIIDMARRMIQLTGHTVKDVEQTHGDIAIEVIGLRPGEKLYEELLLSDNVQETVHPKIMQAFETFYKYSELTNWLSQLEDLEKKNDCLGARGLLQDIVQGYQPSSPVVDVLYEAG